MNLAWKLALVVQGRGAAPAPRLVRAGAAPRRGGRSWQAPTSRRSVVTLRCPVVAHEVRNRLAGLLSSLEVVQQRMLAQASRDRDRLPRQSHRRRAPRAHRARRIGKRVGEGPTLGDWMGFGGAPHPGDRAPDVELEEGESASFALLPGTSASHTAPLRRGAHPPPRANENPDDDRSTRARAAGSPTSRAGSLVAPRGEKARGAGERKRGRVLLDPRGALATGAVAGGERVLYLIRPDGYVGAGASRR